MVSIEQIDNLYNELQVKPLSQVLPMLYNMALEFKDYEGFFILNFWEKPTIQSTVSNIQQIDDITKILITAGLTKDVAEEIKKESFEKYLLQRYVDEEKVCSLSAKEIEDSLKTYNDMLSVTEIPTGLHPVDLYFKTQAAENEKLDIISHRMIIEKQYAILRAYITSKLTQYRSYAQAIERKASTEKGIKRSNQVFIIHGHNEAKLRELKELVISFHLEPVILSEKASQGMTIIEKFETYATPCAFAFALFTPDDIVEADNGEKYFQARPNVIFELGWFYSNLGRSRVCILSQNSEKNEIFSDLQGVMRIQFNQNIEERYREIQRELQSAGLI